MSLSPGTRLGSYEVTAQIGQGGMGSLEAGAAGLLYGFDVDVLLDNAQPARSGVLTQQFELGRDRETG